MAQNNNEKTIPGFTLQSQHFTVKFVAGFEKGLPSKFLEYETDWMEVIKIILETFEIFPTSVSAVEEVLTKALDEWIIANALTFNIKTMVKIEENLCFPPPLGSQKSMKISFSDKFQTEVYFIIKKKSSMNTLKELGATAVVENMKKEIDIAKLDVPVTLFYDLLKAFRNDFSIKYHKANINCCVNHKEGIIERSQLCNLSKRRSKDDGKKQQQNKRRKVDIAINKEQKTKTQVTCPGCGRSFVRIASHKCKSVVLTQKVRSIQNL